MFCEVNSQFAEKIFQISHVTIKEFPWGKNTCIQDLIFLLTLYICR